MTFGKLERGQGLFEYSLIILLVALVLIVVVGIFGTQLSTLFSQITSAIP
jgi:pilus assembly protein Flp/PilA